MRDQPPGQPTPPTGERTSPPPIGELQLLSSTHTNVMLEGRETQVEAALAAFASHLSGPLTTWSAGMPLPVQHGGTLIVPKVDRLDEDGQRQLVRWFEETAGAVRVVTTTSGSLYALVQRGAFLERLYYLLNVVRLEIQA
jgi:hypothetical protein